MFEVVFLLVLVGVMCLAFWIGRTRDTSASPRRPEHGPWDQPDDPDRRRPARRADVFEADSAERLPQPRILSGTARIVDGDTITIGKTQIRLFGIDAPELDHPFGQKSKWALIGLCKNRTIRAEITEVDHYGRTVARCFLPDGRDLSAEMVKRGWAIDWPKFSGGAYAAMEVPDIRKRLFLADARQKGRMDVWEKYATWKAGKAAKNAD